MSFSIGSRSRRIRLTLHAVQLAGLRSMILNCSEQSEQRPRRRERPVRRTVPKAGLEVLFSRLRHGGGALMAKELPPCGPRGPPASRYNFCALHSRVPASLSSPPSFVPFSSAVQAYLAYALHVLALASRSPRPRSPPCSSPSFSPLWLWLSFPASLCGQKPTGSASRTSEYLATSTKLDGWLMNDFAGAERVL